MQKPSIRTLLMLSLSLVTLTLLDQLDYTHPKDDALHQSVTTKNFRISVTTYHNRHGNRCMTLREGAPDAARTPLKTRCDVVYLAVTDTLTNASRTVLPADYVSTRWEAVSRTYNDGIAYISNDFVLDTPPLGGGKVHFSRNGTKVRGEWFSLAPSPGGVAVLRQWVRRGRLAVSCDNNAVECHDGVVRYSCGGATDPRGCRCRAWGAGAVRAAVETGAGWAAVARVGATLRALRGRKHHPAGLSAWVCAVAVGVVAFAGMQLRDMAWLLARVVGVRYWHAFDAGVLQAGDVYRRAGLRGVYHGYAYVWRDGVEAVKVSGPGVALVVGLVSVGLFLQRALFDGVLVRCVMAVVGVYGGCAVVEKALKKNPRTQEADDDYFPADVARQYAKRGSSRLFVRDRRRR